ncbi:hypothetical protein [Paenibacillus elgii]|nr:hypothetical protein [Paenibacillus elgii]
MTRACISEKPGDPVHPGYQPDRDFTLDFIIGRSAGLPQPGADHTGM